MCLLLTTHVHDRVCVRTVCYVSSRQELELDIENELLLTLNPASSLCLDPSPTLVHTNAFKRLNTGHLQTNVWNQRCHYHLVDQVRACVIITIIVTFIPFFLLHFHFHCRKNIFCRLVVLSHFVFLTLDIISYHPLHLPFLPCSFTSYFILYTSYFIRHTPCSMYSNGRGKRNRTKQQRQPRRWRTIAIDTQIRYGGRLAPPGVQA